MAYRAPNRLVLAFFWCHGWGWLSEATVAASRRELLICPSSLLQDQEPLPERCMVIAGTSLTPFEAHIGPLEVVHAHRESEDAAYWRGRHGGETWASVKKVIARAPFQGSGQNSLRRVCNRVRSQLLERRLTV